MTTAEPPRWLRRFDNYKRAFALLREAIEQARTTQLTQLEKEGTIQRFEYTWELAWKVIKDYLDDAGTVLETITPASTVKAAFAAKIISDGESWMRALDTRNKMSHTYNFKKFDDALTEIDRVYLALFDDLHLFLLEKAADRANA